MTRYPRHRFSSEKQYEYIKDLYTARYYDWMIPYEDDLEKEAAYGSRIWKSQEAMTPEEALATAVIGQAVIDFLDIYRSRFDGRGYISLEEMYDQGSLRSLLVFFRQNDLTQAIMDRMMYEIRTAWSLDWLISNVKRCHGRFLANLGKEG